MESSTNKVAQTILEQLGGSRFVAMTGANQLVALERGLQFKLGRGAARRINKVRIVLTQDDLYQIDYYRVEKGSIYHIAHDRHVEAATLRRCFTNITGMDCTL